jgi:hypothetical protein
MNIFARLLLCLSISVPVLYAYTPLEDLMLSKTHPIAGTFGKHDFTDVTSAFDWAFTTAMGTSYQLQGKPANETNVFGWKQVDIEVPEAAWAMFPLDVDGDGTIGKFEWILVGSKTQAVYKLSGISDTGTFEYSSKIGLYYTIDNGVVTFSTQEQPAPTELPQSSDITTSKKATSVAKTTMALIGTTSSVTGSLSALTSLTKAAHLRSNSALRTATTQSCSGGGTMAMELNYNKMAKGILDIGVEYTNCHEGPLLQDGFLKLEGTIDLKSYAVSNLIATFSSFNVTLAGATTTINGVIDIPSASSSELNMIINASIDGTIDGHNVAFDYHDYAVVIKGNSVEINGGFKVDYTPDSCIDGDYNIKTITPLTITDNGDIVSGSMRVNTQLYTFNADGTLSTVVNGETIIIEPSDEIEMCS